MLQRRMNNWTPISDRGIKCLEVLSCVHTSGIGAFYTFEDNFRRTSGIQWCRYPAETINENRRKVLAKLPGGFRFAHRWRLSHAVLSVNSTHGNTRTILPTAQWCAKKKKRLCITNLRKAGCSLHPTPISTMQISSGSAAGLSRM